MKKTILLIAGLAAGIVLHAQTPSDTTKIKTPDSQQTNLSGEATLMAVSHASIKDLEYESWDSYYSLVSNEFYQRDQLNISRQPANRKTHREKIKVTRKE